MRWYSKSFLYNDNLYILVSNALHDNFLAWSLKLVWLWTVLIWNRRDILPCCLIIFICNVIWSLILFIWLLFVTLWSQYWCYGHLFVILNILLIWSLLLFYSHVINHHGHNIVMMVTLSTIWSQFNYLQLHVIWLLILLIWLLLASLWS